MTFMMESLVKDSGSEVREMWVQILAVPLMSCVTCFPFASVKSIICLVECLEG